MFSHQFVMADAMTEFREMLEPSHFQRCTINPQPGEMMTLEGAYLISCHVAGQCEIRLYERKGGALIGFWHKYRNCTYLNFVAWLADVAGQVNSRVALVRSSAVPAAEVS